jgi:hypothetical protein
MAYPTTPVFQSLNLRSNDKTLVSQSVNGRTQSRKIASQFWEFSAAYPPMTRSEFMPVYAYLMAQRGQHQTFSIQLPVLDDSNGAATGTLKSTATHTAGSTNITVGGAVGTLLAGDMVKFGHDKTYMITAATTTSIDIMPPLRIGIANGEVVNYQNVTMKVRLKNDVQEFGISNDGLFSYEVDFIEAL